MLGDERPVRTMASTTTTTKASAATRHHRARYLERLAGGTGVKLPGWSGRGAGLDDCVQRAVERREQLVGVASDLGE